MQTRAAPIGLSTLLQILFVCAMWGGNVVAVKVSLAALPPFWAAWWRMLLGALVVAVWAARGGIRLIPKPGEWKPLAVVGILFAAQISLLNLGVDRTSPAYAVVILNSHPVFANLLGHFASHEERLRPARVAGLVLAFGGVCLLALGHPIETLARDPLTGNCLLIASALLLGMRNIYTRGLVQSVDPTRAVTWMMTFALPLFLAPALLLEPPLHEPLTAGPVLALAYQSIVVAGYCFIAWTSLLRRYTAGMLSMLSFTIPFFGVTVSAVVLREPITARILVAVALVTAGIAISRR